MSGCKFKQSNLSHCFAVWFLHDNRHNFHFLPLYSTSLPVSFAISVSHSFLPSVLLLSTSWLLSAFLLSFIWYNFVLLWFMIYCYPLHFNWPSYSCLGIPFCLAKSHICSGFRISLLWFMDLVNVNGCEMSDNRTLAMFITVTNAFGIQTENSYCKTMLL